MARNGKWTGRHLGFVLAGVLLAGCGAGEDEVLPDASEPALKVPPSPLPRDETGGKTDWVHTVRSAAESDTPVAIAHDASGNVLTLGNHRTPVDFGQGPLGSTAGASVLTVSKYAPDGRLLWVRLLEAPPPAGTSSFVRGQALAVEKSGAFVLVGVQSGGLRLGASVLPAGAFLARLDAEGRAVSARALATSASEVAVDNRGHVTLAGVLSGRVDFGNGPITGTGNPYLVQYDAAGALRWVLVEPARGVPMDLALDDSGELYLSGGRFLPPSPLLIPFLTRVSSEGQRRWTRQLQGASGLAMSVAAHGDFVTVSGYFTGSFVFRGETLLALTSRGFALTYGRDGDERWGMKLGTIGGLVAMDQGSGVVLAGRYTGGEDFGLGLGAREGYPGATNLYVLRLQRPTGKLQWVRTFPSASALPVDLSVARQGESVLTGSFQAPVDFGTGALNPGPGGNAFVVQLGR